MCADCLPGYSRDGRGGCKKCGEKGLNILFPVLVGCCILLVLFLLVYSTVVKRGGAFDSSDGARKIFISYLQLAGLATTMKIPWPVDYRTLFRIEGIDIHYVEVKSKSNMVINKNILFKKLILDICFQ